jgi:hypothetical protein
MWNNVCIVILWIEDLDEVGHNLLGSTNSDFGTLHNLDFNTKDTLTKFDVTNSDINEIFLGLTSGYLVTGVVFLGLCTLSTNLTGDDNFTTGSTTTAHNSAHDVVCSHTDWGSSEKFVFKSLNVC